jgi:voltage-gated potassium channel Kch
MTPRAALAAFWSDDRGLSVFLVSLLVMVFVVPPLRPSGMVGTLLVDAIFSLVLISGAAAAGRTRPQLTVLTLMTAAALVVRWASWLFPASVHEMWNGLSALAILVPLCVVILSLVLRSGPVTRRRIEGAIAAYVLLGVTWAQAYEMVALAHAGAFAGRVDDTGGFTGWLYYSFVTLTTVGYGDIVPVHPIARSLAVLEALTGQLYPAILLARLVSLEVTSRSGGAR